ncbi:hypothetical protein JTE90_020684 [Oedothorax gibbosus]|uniref:Uncharacterized protein n=1 Tax=Oedothorax gibbosus TaxID=931172 RepID=A0AAV6V6Y5_9ARAC|nr:hypothetical protein JTE90_020684 [Oedothorax gibbosus]
MLVSISCCVLFLFGLSSEVVASGSQCDDPAVEKFAASLYTALLISLDPDTIFSLEKPGKEASHIYYDVIYKDLSNRHLCNAHYVAKTVADTVASYDTFHVSRYLESRGIVVGSYLLQSGVLSCDNAVDYALEYFKLVITILNELDQEKFESYVIALSNAVVDYLEELNLESLEESTADLAFIFRQKLFQTD